VFRLLVEANNTIGLYPSRTFSTRLRNANEWLLMGVIVHVKEPREYGVGIDFASGLYNLDM